MPDVIAWGTKGRDDLLSRAGNCGAPHDRGTPHQPSIIGLTVELTFLMRRGIGHGWVQMQEALHSKQKTLRLVSQFLKGKGPTQDALAVTIDACEATTMLIFERK